MSVDLKKQARFMRQTRQALDNTRRFRLEKRHYDFIRYFLRKERRLGWLVLVCILFQNISEIGLIVLSRWSLRSSLATGTSPIIVSTFIFLIILFLGASFFAIKLEKTWAVKLINELRRRLIKGFLNRRSEQAQTESQAQLIAKVSYHLTLVSMGATNSVVGAVSLAFLWPGIIVITILGGAMFWPLLLVVFGLALGLLFAGYFISRHYVNLEATFYSEIIRQIDQAGSEWSFLKKFKQEKNLYQKIDELVDLDSYVRVRRDLWMKFSNSIVFIILIIINIGATVYLKIFSPFNLVSAGDKFLAFAFLFYASLLLYGHVRAGLFFPPLKLGIILTVPQFFRNFSRFQLGRLRQELIFRSRKTKLFKEGKYYKNLEFVFQPGQRVLIHGAGRCGKTSLAKIFSGATNNYPLAWQVKLDGRRLAYPDWSANSLTYYIDPDFRSQKKILEVIIGKNHEMITPKEISMALEVLTAQPLLLSAVASDRKVQASAEGALKNITSNFAIQAAHCLVVQPSIIVVDNLWLDLGYPAIVETLQLLASRLPQAIIVVFSRQLNNVLTYDQIYGLVEKK